MIYLNDFNRRIEFVEEIFFELNNWSTIARKNFEFVFLFIFVFFCKAKIWLTEATLKQWRFGEYFSVLYSRINWRRQTCTHTKCMKMKVKKKSNWKQHKFQFGTNLYYFRIENVTPKSEMDEMEIIYSAASSQKLNVKFSTIFRASYFRCAHTQPHNDCMYEKEKYDTVRSFSQIKDVGEKLQ